jgi:hypothetical protein
MDSRIKNQAKTLPNQIWNTTKSKPGFQKSFLGYGYNGIKLDTSEIILGTLLLSEANEKQDVSEDYVIIFAK